MNEETLKIAEDMLNKIKFYCDFQGLNFLTSPNSLEDLASLLE